MQFDAHRERLISFVKQNWGFKIWPEISLTFQTLFFTWDRTGTIKKIRPKRFEFVFVLFTIILINSQQLTWLDILDIEILLLLKLFTILFSDCRCRGDFGLLGMRFMGDIGGECNEGVKLPLLLLKLRLLLCEPPLASCVENVPFWFMGGCCLLLLLPCCSVRLNGIVLGVGAAGYIFCLIVIIFCPFGSSYIQ